MSTDIPTNDTPEIPETPETEGRSPETQKKTVNHWIADLIETKQSIDDIKEIRDAINDPTKYDTWLASIGNEINLKYREDADQTNEPIDKDIVKKCFENKEFIVAKAQKALFKRELAERDLHKYWTGYTIEDSSGHTLTADEIQDIIEKVPTNQLTELTKNITKSINHLSEYTIMTPHITEYISIMGVNVGAIDPKQRKKLLFQFATFEGTGDFDEEMLSILFEHIPDADKKRETIKIILPKISLKDAIEKGIISKDKKQDILESVFFDYLRDNGFLTGGESALSDWLAHSDSTIASQREYHKNAFIAEANKNTGGVYIDTAEQEFFQDGKVFSDASFDHDAFDSTFEAIMPMLNLALKDRLIDNETQNQKELVEHSGTFEDMKIYLQNQVLPGFAEGNIHLLGDEIYICTQSTNPTSNETQKRTWKIKNSHEIQDGTPGLRLISYNTIGEVTRDEFVSYGQFAKDFLKEVSMADATSIHITANEPDFLQVEELINTREEFKSILDEIDSDGKKYGIETGLSFTIEKDGEKEVVQITNILESRREIQITLRNGVDQTYNWFDFVNLMKEGNNGNSFEFRRIGHFSNQTDFVNNSAISGEIEQKNGKIKFKDTVNSVNENGKVTSEKKLVDLRILSNGKGEHIMLKKYNEYSLEIWHYGDVKTKIKEGDGDSKTEGVFNKDGTPKKAYRKLKGLSYEQLEEFVQRGFNHPMKEPPKGQTTQEENEEKYENKSFLWGVISQPGSIYSKYLAIKMGWQKLQSNREQQAQVEAAEAMYEWAKRYLPEGSDIRYAFTTEFSHTVGGEINKKMEEIGTLGATEKRKKIRKILLTKPRKPYELFAALIVTAKMAGELYPDAELAPLQGDKYLWFTALAESMGLNPNEELKAAKKKVIGEYGPQKEHLPETALITRLFKKNNAHPYVTAIGSGAKYWHSVTEGLEGQKGKGEKESKVLGGAEEVSIYAMSKFKSNELPIVAGSIPVIHDKDPSAQYMAPAFVWAMSNATNLVRGDISKDDVMLKNIVNGGSAFHAFCFSGSPGSAKKYQDTVRIVVQYLVKEGKISSNQGNEFETLYAHVQQNQNTHNEDLFVNLGEFWNKHYTLLHPILQGTSPELFTMMSDPDVNGTVIQEYLNSFNAVMGNKFENSKGMDDTIAMFNGYNADETGSMIFQLQEKGSKYKSLGYILGKCGVNGHNLTMDNPTYNHIWQKQIMMYMETLHTHPVFQKNEEYRKTQYTYLIKEIISHIRPKVGEPHHPEEVFERAKKYESNNYLKDLENLGVNISEYNAFMNENIDIMAEKSYVRFMQNTPKNSTKKVTGNIPTITNKIIDSGSMGKPANDADWDFRNAA